MLRTVWEKTFEYSPFRIDGVHFVRCRFVGVQLIYGAEDEVYFEDCAFEKCSWTFEGAAERMIGFLSTLHHQVKPEGQELVEGIFKSVQNRKVEEIRSARAVFQPLHAKASASAITVKTTEPS